MSALADATKLGSVNVVVLFGVMLFPTLLGWACLAAARLWRRRQYRAPGPVAMGQPIERIAADLRRLNRQRSELRAQPPGPGRGLRAQALTAAYVDVLTAACRMLDVAPPRERQTGRLATIEIDRVESELQVRGLDVSYQGAS